LLKISSGTYLAIVTLDAIFNVKGGGAMNDVLYVGLSILLVVSAFAFIKACSKLE